MVLVVSFLWSQPVCAAALLLLSLSARELPAQDRPAVTERAELLSLRDARTAALRLDPAVRSAKEAVAVAAARERQSAAFPNPSLAYGREQTSRVGQSNAQDIAQIEWPLDVAGQRSARIVAARLRVEVAEARLAGSTQAIDAELVRVYIEAMSAEHRIHLADAALRTAREAQRVGNERVRAGDVAAYVDRRLRLEVGRYAARRAEAAMQARAAREQLALLTGVSADRIAVPTVAPGDTASTAFTSLLATMLNNLALPSSTLAETCDSLVGRALAARADVIGAGREVQAALADARLAARERVPMPALSAGYKGERVQSGASSGVSLYGFVAGFSLPLPLFDRRVGAVAAADATARQTGAEADLVRRRVTREVTEAFTALRGAQAEYALLQPFAGAESRLALRAVQAAYAEGEITLAEWLEAVRAWQETELTLLTLTTNIAQRRVALARAAGVPLFSTLESIR